MTKGWREENENSLLRNVAAGLVPCVCGASRCFVWARRVLCRLTSVKSVLVVLCLRVFV